MQNWLKDSGAQGLNSVALHDFPGTGRGVKALRAFKPGEEIFTIPGMALWTADMALADPHIGLALRSLKLPLSAEEILAVFILFVKSRADGYEERRSHIDLLPTLYTNTMYFTDEELKVCAGSSLYTNTNTLKEQIRGDFARIQASLFTQDRELFPCHHFTLENVSRAGCSFWL
jgi:hypothetical protein